MVTEVRSATQTAPMAEQATWRTNLVQGDTARNVGLGSLAVLSLALMFLMLRRAGTTSPPEGFDASHGVVDPNGADVEVVDEVEDYQVVLEGVEIGDEAVRRSVMLEQLTASVESNQEEVANVLRRWVRTEH